MSSTYTPPPAHAEQDNHPVCLTSSLRVQEIPVCDTDFAEWLIWHVEATAIDTAPDHTVVRTHQVTSDDVDNWWRWTEAQFGLVSGYMPRPDSYYVTCEPSTGTGPKGSIPFDTEDQALAFAQQLLDARTLDLAPVA